MEELEDFAAMENEGFLQKDLNLSNVYSVREGGFGTDGNLKTFLTTLSVEELQEDIKFYETLSADKNWPVSQIIQREVDQDRVNGIAKKYLLGSGREIKYFPPIIIALLPRDLSGNFSPAFNFYPDISEASRELIFEKSKYRGNATFKKLFSDKKNQSVVDGLYLYNTSAVFEHSLLCWDQSKFYAVVIDGQHRLEALIKSKAEDGKMACGLQDVIFVDVSNFVQKKTDFTPVEVLRTIFIDINTNAKSVGLVRRILMDDKDLSALCVQSLVESVTKEGKSKVEGEFIPSNLVDWDGGSLKHELPHVTGVLTLYQIVSDELVSDRLTSIDDHRDLKKIEYFIQLLNNTFFVDGTLKIDGNKFGISTLEQSFKAYLKEKEVTREMFSEESQEEGLDSILFNYDYRVLEVAQENFIKYYQKPIVRVFTGLLPYIKTVEKLKEINGYDQDSALYRVMLLSKNKIVADKSYRDVYIDAKQKLSESLNPAYNLLFTVVGQKAIFRCLFDRLSPQIKYGVTPGTLETSAESYIQELNGALQKLEDHNFLLFGKEEITIPVEDGHSFEVFGTIYSSFWEGILYEDKRIIYNSQGVRAFADIIDFILAAFNGNASIDANIRFSEPRTKRLLKKRFQRQEAEYDVLAKAIMLNKKQYLIDRIINAIINPLEVVAED
jgi:hypothetical protein